MAKTPLSDAIEILSRRADAMEAVALVLLGQVRRQKKEVADLMTHAELQNCSTGNNGLYASAPPLASLLKGRG